MRGIGGELGELSVRRGAGAVAMRLARRRQGGPSAHSARCVDPPRKLKQGEVHFSPPKGKAGPEGAPSTASISLSPTQISGDRVAAGYRPCRGARWAVLSEDGKVK